MDDGALLLLPAVSLVGTTVICCIGMLLFPGNAPVATAAAAASLHPQHSQGATRPPITVISCPIRRLLFFHLSPQASFSPRRRPNPPSLLPPGSCASPGAEMEPDQVTVATATRQELRRRWGVKSSSTKWDTSSSRRTPPSQPAPPPFPLLLAASPSLPSSSTGLPLGAGDSRDGGG